VPELRSSVAGVLVEPVGAHWAAFSPVSGETHLLNDEAAAILEILDGRTLTDDALIDAIAADCAAPRSAVQGPVAASWAALIAAGLVREAGVSAE
jgi:PqqD family protein of HPr-rel-A system